MRRRVGGVSPSTVIDPPSTGSNPETVDSVVVLPAPFAPSRATTSPARTTMSTSRTTGTPS